MIENGVLKRGSSKPGNARRASIGSICENTYESSSDLRTKQPFRPGTKAARIREVDDGGAGRQARIEVQLRYAADRVDLLVTRLQRSTAHLDCRFRHGQPAAVQPDALRGVIDPYPDVGLARESLLVADRARR